MKKSRFSEKQFIGVLEEQQAGLAGRQRKSFGDTEAASDLR
jgi:hypothetical protein